MALLSCQHPTPRGGFTGSRALCSNAVASRSRQACWAQDPNANSRWQESEPDHVVCGRKLLPRCCQSVPEIDGATGVCPDPRRRPGDTHVACIASGLVKMGRPCLLAAALLLVNACLPQITFASTAEKVASSLQGSIPNELLVPLLASLPVIELRGAIPVSVALLGVAPVKTYLLAIAGNMLPVPLILLGMAPLARALSRIPACKGFLDRVYERSRRQGDSWKENEFWALALFVGVPLPGTGAWSGAMAAAVLRMPFAKALAANFVGVLIAGAIVLSLTMLGWYGLLLGVALLGGIPLAVLLRRRLAQRDNE